MTTLIGCQQLQDNDEVSSAIEEIRLEYAPDKRVALWDVHIENNKVLGETNLPLALDEFKTELDKSGNDIKVEVELLPAKDLEGQIYAVVRNSVANIRSEPRHSAELSTQAIMGTPLNVLKKDGGWYLVQTPDKYLSWVDDGGIELMDSSEFEKWSNAEKVVFTGLTGFVYETNSQKVPVTDLAAGNILQVLKTTNNGYQVQLPDGREGFLSDENTNTLTEWIASHNADSDKLIATAKSMMGAPYLWGGTSTKGMDCSGFTKTIYFMSGQIIPRDASQQVHEGILVDDAKNWDQLEKGDLLFFGRPATDTSKERVVHVGMWIGNDQFIHSSGRVRISSVDPDHPLYDEFNVNRYLKTKRILNTPSENIIPVQEVVSAG